MFKFLPLLWAGLQRRKLRTVFTLASVLIAFLLYGVLPAVRAVRQPIVTGLRAI